MNVHMQVSVACRSSLLQTLCFLAGWWKRQANVFLVSKYCTAWLEHIRWSEQFLHSDCVFGTSLISHDKEFECVKGAAEEPSSTLTCSRSTSGSCDKTWAPLITAGLGWWSCLETRSRVTPELISARLWVSSGRSIRFGFRSPRASV